MPILLGPVNSQNGGTGYLSGQFEWPQGLPLAQSKVMPYPFGTSAVYTQRASVVSYRSRSYWMGGHDSNIVIDEHRRASRMGIPAPTGVPGLSVGAGTTAQIGYFAYYDIVTDEWGPLGGGSSTQTGNTTRSWTGIPTAVEEEDVTFEGNVTLGAPSLTLTSVEATGTRFDLLRPGDRIALSSDPDRFSTILTITSRTNLTVDKLLPAGAAQTITVRITSRVTHVGLIVSVSGATPRLAQLRQIGGPSTASEAVATLSLGQAFEDEFGRFPRCTMNAIYHDRLYAAGDEKHRDTLYLSLLFNPEKCSTLTLKTRNGEPITGLAVVRNNALLVLCPRSSYLVTGYTEDDIVMDESHPALGAFNHNSVVVIGGDAWIPNAQGIFKFNGAWHSMLKDRTTEWQGAYADNPDAFEQGFGYHDEPGYCYVFRPNGADAWVGYYAPVEPEIAGGYSQPFWTNDTDTIAGAALVSNPGSGAAKVYYGLCDGTVYEEDPDDTSTATTPPAIAKIRTGHMFYGTPGGTKDDGKTQGQIWSYVRSEYGPWSVAVWGGDAIENGEEGINTGDGLMGVDVRWAESIAASLLEVTGPPLQRFAPKLTHTHNVQGVHGNGFRYEWQSFSIHFSWNGFSANIGPGAAARPMVFQEAE